MMKVELKNRLVVLVLVLGASLPVAFAAPQLVNDLAALKSLQSQVVELVKKVQPATVSLTSEQTGAWGSGVVVSKDGRILTAAHVVQGTPNLTVIFPDGTERKAIVLGANRSRDTAMLQIKEVGEYPFVELGDSDDLSVGDFLVSLGHAGGYDALRKPPARFGRLVSRNIAGFFSSDCTLIGGDSGGPIFDISGKLVGINSSIGEALMANNHAGISGLKADWKRLESGETWGRMSANPFANADSPVLGVAIIGATKQGVLLGPVVQGSPAHLAGIKEGDVLISVEGKRVRDGGGLLIELNKYRAGQEVKVEVIRGSAIVEFSPTLGRRGDMGQQ